MAQPRASQAAAISYSQPTHETHEHVQRSMLQAAAAPSATGHAAKQQQQLTLAAQVQRLGHLLRAGQLAAARVPGGGQWQQGAGRQAAHASEAVNRSGDPAVQPSLAVVLPLPLLLPPNAPDLQHRLPQAR